MSRRAPVSPTSVGELFEGVDLAPVQRVLAQCIIENAREASYLSTTQVTKLAGVSQPTATRLAARLGYEGYPELRSRVRELATTSRSAPPGPPEGDQWQRVLTRSLETVRQLGEYVDDASDLIAAGEILASSSTLPVFGLRAAMPLAHHFGVFGSTVHPDLRVISDGGSSGAGRIHMASLSGAAAMLVFALPRHSREVTDAVEFARDLGLQIVAVTDDRLSPIGKRADVALYAGVASGLMFDAHAAPYLLSSLLLQSMTDALGPRGRERLEKFEEQANTRPIFRP
jgi:DNA-binding MurR/RpiR family transcriptional regulator